MRSKDNCYKNSKLIKLHFFWKKYKDGWVRLGAEQGMEGREICLEQKNNNASLLQACINLQRISETCFRLVWWIV